MKTNDIQEQEIAEVLEAYRKCPENKKAIVIAFIQGMETQKTISLITSLGTKQHGHKGTAG